MDIKAGTYNLGRKMRDIPVSNRIPELGIALEAADEAGKAILEIYRGEFTEFTKKDESPVTEADLKSNEIIKKYLSKTTYHILSEEDEDDLGRLSEETVWIVDPLDGTSDFIDKTGEFTVMIALVKNKKPVLGVIAWPTEKTFFVAQQGEGAYRFSDGRWERISVTSTDSLTRCRAVGSRHHLSDKEKSFIRKLGVEDFTSIGSSLKVGKISSGEAEAYITTTNKMKEWDTAAAYCIITEAGGKMTDMSGNEINYNNKDVYHQNGILVTNGPIHNRIVDEFKKLE